MRRRMPPEDTNKKHYHGHRARLRERLLQGGDGSLSDYELLEILLFGAHARKDVKPVAKELLEACGGSLASVFHGDIERFSRVDGVNAHALALLRAIREISERALKERASAGIIVGDWKMLVDYCRMTMGYHATEQFRVLYLNTRNKILEDALQETGTIDHTPVYTREIIKRAVALDAKSIILAHNHPGGDARPSEADITMTRHIHQALKIIDVKLLDHMIVSRDTHFSFRKEGLL